MIVWQDMPNGDVGCMWSPSQPQDVAHSVELAWQAPQATVRHEAGPRRSMNLRAGFMNLHEIFRTGNLSTVVGSFSLGGPRSATGASWPSWWRC